jgi:uncharacterized protein with GYD domain
MKKVMRVFWDWVFSKTTVDEKVIATVKETKKRVKAIKAEIKDVGEAIKEVGNQAGDIADAVKGKARKGRKKKNVK